MKIRSLLHNAICAAVFAFASAANGATNSADLQVVARAVGFVGGLPRGTLVAAVVDGPNADAIIAAMGGGVGGGGVTLLPRKVSVGALAQSGARVIIVPEGQEASYAAISHAAATLRAVTVSTDMNCVRQGHCVVGVSAKPRVEIVVSRAAARANAVTFGQAFRVMIREI